MRRAVHWVLAALLIACGEPADSIDAGDEPRDAGASTADAGAVDAAVVPADAAVVDAGASGAWRAETPTPEPIQEIAVEAHAGLIWLAGGFNSAGAVVADVRTYDPSTGEWAVAPSLPAPRHHMNMVSHAGDLYALGGMQTLGFEPLDTAWVLRADATEWAEVASLPVDRGAAAADSVGDVIVMAGGNESRGGLAQVTLIYDPAMNLWRTGMPIPTEREHLAASAYDGELYVLAGRRNSLGSTRAELEIYNPTTDMWRTGPELPYPRGGFDSAVLDGAIYVVGGEEPRQVLTTVDRFVLETETWEAAPPTARPHHGHGVAAFGGRIFVVAGGDRPSFAAFDYVESYAP